MTDRPIIFSAPMVRALLNGRKTQTRRILKPQPAEGYKFLSNLWQDHHKVFQFAIFSYDRIRHSEEIPSRFHVGDRLWVRESWYCDHVDCQRGPYLAPEPLSHERLVDDGFLHFMATDDGSIWEEEKPRWRPSIHMPRWASRMTLTVTDVRVQQLQDISEEDARAEGFLICTGTRFWEHYCDYKFAFETALESFQSLWNSLHKKPGNRWDDNPWLVALSFTVQRGNIDEVA